MILKKIFNITSILSRIFIFVHQKVRKIFFEGQIYDAYSLIIDIIKKANKKILIIDNYIDDSILKMLTKKKNKQE